MEALLKYPNLIWEVTLCFTLQVTEWVDLLKEAKETLVITANTFFMCI